MFCRDIEPSSAFRPLIAVVFGLTVGLALVAGCDDLGNDPCSQMCDEAGYDQVDENAEADGTVDCKCGGSGRALTQGECENYCSALGGVSSSLSKSTCTCEMVDGGQFE